MSQAEWQAITGLKQVLACDEEFRLEWCDPAVALVRHISTWQNRYIAIVTELAAWRQAFHDAMDRESARGCSC